MLASELALWRATGHRACRVIESLTELILLNLRHIIRVNRAEHSVELLFPIRCLLMHLLSYSIVQILVDPLVDDIQHLLRVQILALAFVFE